MAAPPEFPGLPWVTDRYIGLDGRREGLAGVLSELPGDVIAVARKSEAWIGFAVER